MYIINPLIFSDRRDVRDILLQIFVVDKEIETQGGNGMPKFDAGYGIMETRSQITIPVISLLLILLMELSMSLFIEPILLEKKGSPSLQNLGPAFLTSGKNTETETQRNNSAPCKVPHDLSLN